MNQFTKLLAIEWIKVRKRSVFWVAIVVHMTILAVALGSTQYIHHLKPQVPAFSLPEGWASLISRGSQVGMLMMFIAIALLIASEATWRTQRQNIIDGLSRGQYFNAKLIVVLMLAVILWLDILLMGIVIAPFGGSGSLHMPLFTSIAQRMIPNSLLYLIAIGMTAFVIGMLASSSGAAVGLLLAFIIIEPIIEAIMSAQSGAWPSLSRFLPLTVFDNLVARPMYDPDAMARMVAMTARFKRPIPLTLNMSMLVTVIYILAFGSIAWLVFRRRDL